MSQRRGLPLLVRGIQNVFSKDASPSLRQVVRVPSKAFAKTIWKASFGTSRPGRSSTDMRKSFTALTESMHHITITKLAALSKQHQRYETEKANILQAAASEDDPGRKLEILLDAFEVHNIAPPESLSIHNIRRFLEQSQDDASVSPDLLQEWQNVLQKALDIPSHKYEHASLFGHLVMEWLGKSAPSPAKIDGAEPLKTVGRKEMYDQRKEWESIVFGEGSKSDPVAIEDYLNSIFGSASSAKKMVKSPLEALRHGMGSFQLEYLLSSID